MIGRVEQLEQILSAIRALASGGAGGANVLFVTGEAGIGKSTLLAAVARACERMSPAPTVALSECSTPLAGQDIGEVESLQPWGEIMASLITAKPEKRNETTKLVGELALAWVRVIPVVGDVIESLADSTKIIRSHMTKGDQPSGAASQQQIFQQYINFLEKLAERGPLVLMIDDAHWADTASTNLLFAAARQLHERPVLFIVAYRPDDAASSRGGEGHPLLHIRNELERYDLAVDIGVPRMTATDLDALLHSRYPTYHNDDAFEEWIARVSAGNALFISQFLHTLEEDGFIDAEAGTIREGYESIRVPGSAAAVVKERIRRLSEDAREMLRYASVEGDTFTSAVLARITEMPQLKLLQRLRLIEESHRVIRALGKQRVYARDTSAFQFGHVLLHKALYEDLGEEERELVHEAVLDVLKEEWEEAKSEGTNIEGIAARMAVHARVLGQHGLAAEVLLDGARSAWNEYAAEETLRMLDDAARLLEELSPIKRSKPEMVRLVGHVHALRANVLRTCARFDEALASIELARAAFASCGEAERGIDVLNGLASTLRQKGDASAAESAALEAMASADAAGYAEGAASARTTLGHLAANRSEFEGALARYTESLALAEKAGLLTLTSAAHNNIGSIHDSMGEYAEAGTHYAQSLEALRSLHDRHGEAQVLLNMGVLAYRGGDIETARERLVAALEVFRAVGDVLNENAVLINLGILALQTGELETASEHSSKTLDIARRIGDRRAEAAALSTLGEIASTSGEFAAALERFNDTLAIQVEIGDREGEAIACINLADVHSKQSRPDEARELARRAQSIAAAIGSPFIEAMAIGHIGFADSVAAAIATGDDRDRLHAEAATTLRTAITALESMGSPYAETFREMVEWGNGGMEE